MRIYSQQVIYVETITFRQKLRMVKLQFSTIPSTTALRDFARYTYVFGLKEAKRQNSLKV